MTLDDLNTAPEQTVRGALLACCGSERWAEQMIERRPFVLPGTLYAEAEAAWRSLSSSDWLQAFASHPQIGVRSSSKWSTEEQQTAGQGRTDVLNEIREMNSQYRSRFGYIFIVCATGKSAAEIRSALEERLRNEPAAELPIAAAEQVKITRLRLEKLLAE